MDGEFIPLPSYEQQKTAKLNIVVAGTETGIVMVEAGAQQATEDEVLAAIEFGHECCKKIIAGIKRAGCQVAARPSAPSRRTPRNQDIYKKVETLVADRASPMRSNTKKYGKTESYAKIDALEKEAMALFTEPAEQVEARICFELIREKIFRHEMIELAPAARPPQDGRDPQHHHRSRRSAPHARLRALHPRRDPGAGHHHARHQGRRTAHGDASTCMETSKRLMLHYNFPPFSVGEVGFMRGPGRREVGHGALAERSITPVIPADTDFPYTLRIVSDILESNGSSSMATVCGATPCADGRRREDQVRRWPASRWVW